MKLRQTVRRTLLVVALVFLMVVAWGTLAGATQQLPRAVTLGQRVETAVQLLCGLLSLLAVATCFWRRQWAVLVRAAWAGSVAVTGGLSAFVWGPPMPGVALLLAAVALLIALGVNWMLKAALAE